MGPRTLGWEVLCHSQMIFTLNIYYISRNARDKITYNDAANEGFKTRGMVFTRPSSVAYPTVWHRFTVRRQGTTASLRVQDLTEDKQEEALALLSKHFTRDEPPCKYIGINKYPTAVAELEGLWRKTVADRLSLVCVEDKDDGTSSLVGVNVLTVACKDDKEEPFKTEDRIWAKLFGAVDLVARSVDLFQKYGVDKYLTAYGLVVAPEWRGCNIGKEILKAR
ncbi:unnamed protein product, partial [Iphiclides podalirius]